MERNKGLYNEALERLICLLAGSSYLASGESASVSNPTNFGEASSSYYIMGASGLISARDSTMVEGADSSVVQNLSGNGPQAGVEQHEQMDGSVSEQGAD